MVEADAAVVYFCGSKHKQMTWRARLCACVCVCLNYPAKEGMLSKKCAY
jgi:hypothetical protein